MLCVLQKALKTHYCIKNFTNSMLGVLRDCLWSSMPNYPSIHCNMRRAKQWCWRQLLLHDMLTLSGSKQCAIFAWIKYVAYTMKLINIAGRHAMLAILQQRGQSAKWLVFCMHPEASGFWTLKIKPEERCMAMANYMVDHLTYARSSWGCENNVVTGLHDISYILRGKFCNLTSLRQQKAAAAWLI